MTLKINIQQSISDFTKSIELCQKDLYTLKPSLIALSERVIENSNTWLSQQETKIEFSATDPQKITLQCQKTTKQCADLAQSILQSATVEEPLNAEQTELQHQLQTLKNILDELKKCPQFNEAQKLELESYSSDVQKALIETQKIPTAIADQNTERKRKERRAEDAFTNLPAEAVCEILKFLDISNLHSVTLVCRFFNSIVEGLCQIKIKQDFPEYSLDSAKPNLPQYVKATIRSNIAHNRYVEETLPISYKGGMVIHGNSLFANQRHQKEIEAWEIGQKNDWKKVQTLPVLTRGKLEGSLHYDGTYLFIIIGDEGIEPHDDSEEETGTIQVWKKSEDQRFSQIQTLTCMPVSSVKFKEDLLILFPVYSRPIQIWKKDKDDNFAEIPLSWVKNEKGEIPHIKMGPLEENSLSDVEAPGYIDGGEYDGTLLSFLDDAYGEIKETHHFWRKDAATNQFTFLQSIERRYDSGHCFFCGDFILQFFAGTRFNIWKKNKEGRLTLHQKISNDKFNDGDFSVESYDDFVFISSSQIAPTTWKWNEQGFLIHVRTLPLPMSAYHLQFSNNRLFLTLQNNKEIERAYAINFNVSAEKMLACLAKQFKNKNISPSSLMERFKEIPLKSIESIRKHLQDMGIDSTTSLSEVKNCYYMAILKHLISQMSTIESFKLLADAFREIEEGDIQELTTHVQLLNQLIDSLPSENKETIRKYFNNHIQHTPKGFSEACNYIALIYESGMDLSLLQVEDAKVEDPMAFLESL